MNADPRTQLEYHKLQLVGRLTAIAKQLREGAATADQLAQLIGTMSHTGHTAAVNFNANNALHDAELRVILHALLGQSEQTNQLLRLLGGLPLAALQPEPRAGGFPRSFVAKSAGTLTSTADTGSSSSSSDDSSSPDASSSS
ncbi:hypothetical protein C8Q76DRAFT_29003 [Earliella scabrosa]|nr:hypothetical protein C8Q76DRAFT_29003 [Earliella scabrosa]